jgi:hypothetical protein
MLPGGWAPEGENEMDYYIGLEGSPGVDAELKIIGKTALAYHLEDELGHVFWLPKSCFESDGVLTESGVNLYREKVKE